MEQDRLKNKDIFKEIFDKSTIGILIYDKKGKLVDANVSALKNLGISRLKDILGSDIFDHPNINSNRQKLIKEGVINFQSALIRIIMVLNILNCPELFYLIGMFLLQIRDF